MALPILDGNQTATTLSTVLTSGEHIPAHTVVSLGSVAISNITSAVSGSVVSVSNFPSTQTIAGTVTANVLGYDPYNGVYPSLPIGPATDGIAPADNVVKVAIATELGGVNDATPLPISGAVTANSTAQKYFSISAVTANRSIIGYSSSGGNQFTEWDGSVDAEIVINGSSWSNANPAPVSVANSVTIGSLPVISGTVTANNPNGALTTRFGSVATANLAFITSAVTNTSRKYLLAQNISAGTVTIGIGFSPTTTQGIQLTAGGGLTFDAFCPTGAVYWLGAVTGANYCLIEG